METLEVLTQTWTRLLLAQKSQQPTTVVGSQKASPDKLI